MIDSVCRFPKLLLEWDDGGPSIGHDVVQQVAIVPDTQASGEDELDRGQWMGSEAGES